MTTEIRFSALKSKKEKVLDRGQNGFYCEDNFFWCPCMAINVNSVQYNGRLLPDIILVDPMLLPYGNPFKCHEEVLYLQPMNSPLNVLTFFPLTGECSEGLGAF